MNEIDAGYGWELVPNADWVILAHYEHFKGAGKWGPSNFIGDLVKNGTYRRRIDPGEGWEIASEDELKRYHTHANYNGRFQMRLNGEWVTPKAIYIGRGTYRRKQSPAEPVAAKPAVGWVKTSERLPRIGWHLASRNDVKSFAQYGTDAFWREQSERTGELEVVTTPDYWLDAPEPPKPEGDPAWALAKEYLETALQTTCGNCEHAFMAGFRAGQQSNKGEK